jgi:predicted metallopeptidase
MANEYQIAPEVEEIARDLIDKYHPHLASVRIEYVFIGEPAKKRGMEVWGRAKKVTGLNAWLTASLHSKEKLKEPEEFFVLEIAKPIWDKLEEKARLALVDHELCHFDVDAETGKLALQPHDLEEFTIIVRRHGLWRPEVEFFVEAGKQKELFERGYDKVTMKAPDGQEFDITDQLETVRRRRREATA